jgi:hypothetical protein
VPFALRSLRIEFLRRTGRLASRKSRRARNRESGGV